MKFNSYILCDLVDILNKTINPQKEPNKEFNLYSLPSFDKDKCKEKQYGKEINSNKIILPSENIILFNKLNLKFKRVWKLYSSDIEDNSICSTEFLPLIIKSYLVDFDYLYYYLISNKFYNELIENMSGTSNSHQRIKKEDLLDKRVLLPDITTQKKIAKYLVTIDNVIDNYNNMNKTLQNIIDVLFINSITSNYNKTGKLSSLYTFQYGKGNNNPDNGGIYPIYGSNGIIGGYDEFNNEDSPVIGHIGANCGSLIFAYGKHFVTYNGVMCNIKNDNYRYYGYEVLRNLNLQNEVRGSSQPFISYDLLENLDIWETDEQTITKFEMIAKTIYKKIEHNLLSINNMQKIMEQLLPKLLFECVD